MGTRTSIAMGAMALLALSPGCGAYTRFALRPPVWHDGDDRPFLPAPAVDEEQDIANTVDVTLLRPFSHWLLLEHAAEARNVNSLDEVADSMWFTNRTLTPAEVARGACGDDEPTPPFTVQSTKVGGTTAGFVVEDASGQRYVLKLDALAPAQPETSTAADSIASRLYFAVGFNVPCNRVVYVDARDFVRGERSTERLPTGERRPLTAARLAQILTRATLGADGALRISASRFIEGEPIGTWRAEGTRGDDPNDVIPHEDRRELRGERFLAAWVGHWDSRGPQSYDAFVRTGESGGHVVHYFMDFSDSLGGIPTRTRWPEPRVGHQTVSDLPDVFGDALGFGIVRRRWDEVESDPRYPNLGFFGAEHFEPMGFAPQTPLVRWERAQASDLGWMARRLARLDAEHVAAAVRTGRFSDAAEEARLVEVLLERRSRILRSAFARSSPLADLVVSDDRLCAIDLAVASGLTEAGGATYEVEAHEGVEGTVRHLAVAQDGPALCVELTQHFAPPLAPDESAERYATLDLVRVEGDVRTILRAHFYDLGPVRGYTLVGIERP